jgi:serine kinase of HPr protein (carbohydrate metabolism regulator)
MAKIDRLGWAAGICFETHGLRVGIRVNKAEALERVRALLPPGWRPAPPPYVHYLYSLRVGGASAAGKVRNFHLLYSGLARLSRTLDFDECLHTLERKLHHFIAEYAKERVFVHAGVVGWQGKAILVPGRSFSGKSRLVAALLKMGATYYSDEYAILDADGRVEPFPRPLSWRDEKGGIRRLGPEEFGERVGAAPLPVALVAAARYREGARWQPRRLSSGQGLLELFNNTVPAERRPEAALSALSRICPRAACFKGWRGEADDTAELLLRQVEKI